ncbi:MAG: HAD family hydrolase [Planctomycetota bacterium]
MPVPSTCAALLDPPPQWFLLDCFNTIIDDSDESGDTTGVRPLAGRLVAGGWFADVGDFLRAYQDWRRRRWHDGDWAEVLLGDRFRALLLERRPERAAVVPALVASLLEDFRRSYRCGLRLAPGIAAWLAAWAPRARFGVVSNFMLPEWPEQLLVEFGLRDRFAFVLNSAVYGRKKPDRAIYREALRLAGQPDPATVCFIGDNLRNDVHAPRTCGLRSLHLDRSGDLPGVVPSTCSERFSAWHDLMP